MGTTESDLERMLFDEAAEPTALPFSLLQKITRGFSDNFVIGRGGFAVVYRGILDNGAVVAVKRLSSWYTYDKEFQREAQCLMKVKHKNIVRFLGYCADTEGSMEMFQGKLVLVDTVQRLLCFEYVPKGSLEHYITDTSRGLEWRKRYTIIKGICEGLNHLHQNKILHLDLKPSNILIDEDMMPKIIDFGQSRCFEDEQTRFIPTKMGGTIGYLAPELYASREITYKFDLYSLGVIIKEILTGDKGYEVAENILESWKIRSDISQWEQIRVCAEIGIECTELNPTNRPVSIKHIIDRLLKTESTQVIPTDGPSELLAVHQFVLYFPFEPNKVITCPLKLTNNTDRYVAFRLFDKSGESFLRLPLYGIVPPRSPYTLNVSTQERKELPQKSNMDMILNSTTVLGNDYLDILQSQPDNIFQKATKTGTVVPLKAFYTPPHKMIDFLKMGPEPHHMTPKHTRSLPHRLTLQHLKDITNNFSDDQMLGRGSSSVVYKGLLKSGKMVAVKRLVHVLQSSQKQFENEINLLMKLEHPNLVRLLGYCYETQHSHMILDGKIVFVESIESLLCLEYLPNGSLDRYISDASSGLDWHTRWKIIEGISLGLQYLHEQSDSIIHLDLKPANILLDENMVPKLADFGQSRLLYQKQTFFTATISGTVGYMSPEYLERGMVTPMSDIFSLGVIIMEVITGHRHYPYNIRTSSEGFIKHELQKWRNVLQDGPEYASLEIDCQQIKICIQIGLICVNLERNERPTMKQIVDMLEGLESPNLFITKEVM